MNIFYFIYEAILGILKRPLIFILNLFIFIIPIYFTGTSFFLYREGRVILSREKEKWGNFLVEVDSGADIRFLKEQVKSLKEIKGLKDTADTGSGKIVFQADLNIDLNDALKIEETKRMITDLKGVKFVKYQGEEIEYMENRNLLFAGICLFLGIISSIFVVKYIRSALKKESELNKERINILELAGATPFFIYSIFMAKGLLAGAASILLTLLFLRISLENIFISSHLQFFIYPSTLFIVAAGSLFLINIDYYMTIKKEIKI
ncbi:MAG: hypothetical protein PHX78_03620 [bacterium]|nr:hypothetical protein [bacterium]